MLIFYFSISTSETARKIRNRNIERSKSTDTKRRENEEIDTISTIKQLKNLTMSSTAVNSYSSMDSPLFGIPQHRKVRRGLSDIDPKYVSQVRFGSFYKYVINFFGLI